MKKLLLCMAFPIASMAQTQIGQTIIGDNDLDRAGQSTALSNNGEILAIGASNAAADAGMVRVYQNVNGTWTQIGADINGLAAGDGFGSSCSLSGDGSLLAVATPYSDVGGNNTGQVRVFEYSNNSWVQKGSTLNGAAANDAFGTDVALSDDGTHMIVGTPYSDGVATNAGAASVYTFTNGDWAQLGNDIEGLSAQNNTGEDVAISADGAVVAIGSPGNSDSGRQAGLARVFEFTNGAWIQVGANIYGQNAGDWAGEGVELSDDGTVLLIAGRSAQSGAGQIRLFEYASGAWAQKGSDLNGEAAADFSGWSTSLSADGNIVAIGAISNDGNGNSAGHVRVFSYFVSDWIQVGPDFDGDQANDACGSAASLSEDGTTLAIGIYRYGIPNDTINPGAVKVYDITAPLHTKEQLQDQKLVEVYPNPAHDYVFIEDRLHTVKNICVYNINGAKMLETTAHKMFIGNLPQGVYTLAIATDQGTITKKLAIN